MATLTVWKFPTPEGAEQAERTLESLQKQELIKIHDAAMVSWPVGAKKPKTRQLLSTAGAGALGGAFWGMLFGLIFFVPLLGAMTDVGINDEFINTLRNEITPGTSALLLMSSDAVIDKVKDAFAGQSVELVQTNLTQEEELKLREVIAE